MSENQPTLVKKPAKVVVRHPERPAALILRLERKEREKRGIDEWHLPGGCKEPKESLEDTAHREVFEETGFKIRILRELGTSAWNAFYEGEPAHFDATIYEAEVLPDESGEVPEVKMSEESDAAAWVGLDELDQYPALTAEAQRYIVQSLTEVENG